jgi:phosphatidylserine/phosphatidylglycerophosphate/cardiolipin synthase-like enzyme
VNTTFITDNSYFPRRRAAIAVAVSLACFAIARPAAAQERMYFPAYENVTNVLVQKINAETARIDISAWYLTERSVSIALMNRHLAGLPVRLIGDRGSIFEIDAFTKGEFFRLAAAGVPIRLRVHPTWYPEIVHWKAIIFAGQNLVAFGSSNFTPFELAPASPTNYKDETVLLTNDPELVLAFKTKFDQFWNDTRVEPHSMVGAPPYFMNWDQACAREPGCVQEYRAAYPNPAPMYINTARLEADNPMPADMVWGQGPLFNNRLVQEINRETNFVDFAIYRLTVDNITQALLAKHAAGVPVRIMMEPQEYKNRKWPEFWITHANMDKLWAAGIRIKKRLHVGLLHMKMLVTSSYATNASSNLAAAWQRDHNYFVPAGTKPLIYGAMKARFDAMWNDPVAFTDFVPEPPDPPALAMPIDDAASVDAGTSLVWSRAPFAVSYDVYLGTSPAAMTRVGNVKALLINDPPLTYSWQPPAPLQPATTYHWKVVSLTNASHVRPSAVATSNTWNFTTGGVPGPPPSPANPAPTDSARDVGLTPTLTWSGAAAGTTYNVAFGTVNPPPPAASGLTATSYVPAPLAQSTTYFWRVTSVAGASATPGPVWSFTTGNVAGPAEIVLYSSDVTTAVGNWSRVADTSAAGAFVMRSQDQGAAALSAPLAAPGNYFEATFSAAKNTRYRVWVRMRAKDDSKWNDSVFVQFSDSVDGGGGAIYRIGSTSALTENLWTCATCATTGWGWSRHAYWLGDTGEVRFLNDGTHRIRIQTREDGADIDQVVISPAAYLSAPPGPVSNDTTIVPKPTAPEPPPAEPPAAPGSASPANGATISSLTATLAWSAANATHYDVRLGAGDELSVVSAGQTASWLNASGLAENTTYTWQVVAYNSHGSTTGPIWSFVTPAAPPPPPPPPPDVVIYASDISPAAVHGSWSLAMDGTSPDELSMISADRGVANLNAPLASPEHYVDIQFEARAGTPYTIWLRLKALDNLKANDAVWVQFSDALVNGSPIYRINTTSGLLVNLASDAGATSLNAWGWQNGAYWLNQPTTVTFASAGTHTLRVQIREDGVQFDQIVLSPGTYLNGSPGPLSNDATFVAKP